jgi:epoxyqueuosine reductase
MTLQKRIAKAAELGFAPVGFAGARTTRCGRRGSNNGWAKAITARWAGWDAAEVPPLAAIAVAEARSVIALGMSYAPNMIRWRWKGFGHQARISVYAQGRDYHDVVKKAAEGAGPLAGGRSAGGDMASRCSSIPPR